MLRLLSVTAALALTLPAPAADVDFARDVLPVLSDNCFHCHGPDPNTREAGLRLDTPEGAFKKKKDRAMIAPGKSADSEVIRRIFSDDPDERMPPPDSNRKLTPKQAEAIKTWVDAGAKWGQHWAFVPLPRAVPASVGGPPIDAFVRARLAKEGLPPSPPAPRDVWLRRVSLDLTGLPPTLAELDVFLADSSPTADEKAIDRLLASPRYAERMAADWLDLARFADTHGYQHDRDRPMWAYRDWVLKAFAKNQPFDQFLTEQLAGDLLPTPTKDQRLATAFNRLHMQNEEGGIVEEEFRVAYVVDRVTTAGTAFLGLTFECSRCHDHKFDPITQKDFYGLFALFQNIDESGQTSYFTPAMPVPTLLLSTAEQDAKLAELDRKIAAVVTEEAKVRAEAKAGFGAWAKAGKVESKGLVGDFPLTKADAKAKPHEGPKVTESGAELDGENGFTFPGVGHFTRADPFTLAIAVKQTTLTPRAVVVHHSKAPIDAGSRGYELLLEDGKVAFGLHHMWPGNSLKVRTKTAVPVGKFTPVAVSHDGSGKASGVRVYLDGQPAAVEVIRDGLAKDITYGGGEPDLAVGYRFRDSGFKSGTVRDFKVFDRAISPAEALTLANPDAVPDRDALFDYYVSAVDPGAADWRKRLHALRDERRKLVEPIPEAMAMTEMPAPKPAFLLKRGAYDAPGDPVGPGTPAFLPQFPKDEARNRLGFARWLTHPDHPLTARVTVNRLWQQMFGKGLVETSDNFGTTGTPPTHPELLDWLARDFVDHGWDVKRTLKQIAMSATYRQSSRTTPEVRAKDPYNESLARFPARRLTAEMLRDQALFVSGLLVEKTGGPSVYPYQPAGLWDEAMGRPKYPLSTGADLHRRSLYTVWKRTAPHPQMTTFDAADRSVCTARRQSTSTPLQALALLNDPQVVEAARFLGQRMLAEGGATTAERVGWAFRAATGRTPTEREATVLVKLFDEQKAGFAADPAAAAKLLAVGEAKADPKADRVELAAAAALGLAVLNHDEAVNRR